MRTISFALLLVLVAALPATTAEFKCIVLNPDYHHDLWETQPRDHVFKFAAYTTSFDGADDNDGNASSDKWGIPEWVAFEIKKLTVDHPLKNRPTWITDKNLHSQGIAPNDNTYKVSGTRSIKEVKGDSRYVRGHMCPKNTAERISSDAAYNTHTVLNAVPQLQWQNNGIWKSLEKDCEDWADKYERIWVCCGPVFFGKQPAVWLGQAGEVKAAVPDALFKIVIRVENGKVKTMAFLIPNVLQKSDKDPAKFLTSIDRIEKLTGLDFFTALNEDEQSEIEERIAAELWE